MIKRIINKLGVYKTYSLQVGNKQFKVPIHKGLGFTHFADSEPWMDEVLKKLGSHDCKFLDIGVNVGQTLLKWKALFPDSNYVGFEPNRGCVDYVEDLISKNNLNSCKIYPYGLSTTKEKTKLYLLGNDPGDSSATTIENFRENENRHSIEIETIPLSSIDDNSFDVIKIDVEGAELEVLKSIFEVPGTPVITCEVLPVYSSDNIERLNRQNAIATLLSQHDYQIYRIIKHEKISIEKLDSFDVHGDLSKSDYIFLPKSKQSVILAKFN